MAKVGEGDARWIVADREDGANVNAWHWEEKDLSSTVEDGLKQVFVGKELLSSEAMTIKVKDLQDVATEVTVAQRKGKIMCYFEVKMTIKYTGSVNGDDGKVDGKFILPEVDHDSFEDDFEIRVSSNENNSAANKADAWAKSEGRKVIRGMIQKFFQELYEAYHVGKNMKTGGAATSSKPVPAPKPVESKPKAAPPAASSPGKIDWTLEWRAPVQDIWTMLTDQQRASAYTRAPAKIDPRNGGVFEFLGGAISGYYTEVTHPSKLALQWRLSSWQSGVFSTVVIVLEEEERAVTRMQFAQIGIPDGEIDRVKQGWNVNFWEPIKMMFGFAMEFK